MKLYNKKGISPLIATVLVIGFTIVLAGVVMQFIMPLFVQSGEKAKSDAALMRMCSDFGVSLAVKEAKFTAPILSFAVDNPTSTPIHYLIVKYYTDKGAGSCTLLNASDVPAISAGGLVFMSTADNVNSVVAVPSNFNDGTTDCEITTGEVVNKIEVTPVVFMKETKEAKPCTSVTVSSPVY